MSPRAFSAKCVQLIVLLRLSLGSPLCLDMISTCFSMNSIGNGSEGYITGDTARQGPMFKIWGPSRNTQHHRCACNQHYHRPCPRALRNPFSCLMALTCPLSPVLHSQYWPLPKHHLTPTPPCSPLTRPQHCAKPNVGIYASTILRTPPGSSMM